MRRLWSLGNPGPVVVATSSAADSDPRWSPTGTTIAFVSTVGQNSDIYVIRPDGSHAKRLTQSAAADSDPQWSPDGCKLAFTSVRDGNAEIYVMNADGSGQRNLTKNAADDSAPRWSSDGKRISSSRIFRAETRTSS